MSSPSRWRETHAAAARGGPQVAIVASAANNVSDPWFTDPQNRLLDSGRFGGVSVIHAGQVTPTLAELSMFDAVLVWSNFSFADADALGNTLADYVDGGGGVVVAVFATSTSTPGRYLGGRWITHGYETIPSGGGTLTGSASLGTIHVPGHPLVQGVSSFSGGTSSYRPMTNVVVPSGTVIASWNDGSILAAAREDTVGSRVDLGFYPPSDAVLSNFWDSTTDGDLLLANSLHYAATREPLGPGDSNADGEVDEADFNVFVDCFTGPGPTIVAAGCVTFDLDGDDDVDCTDYYELRSFWTGGSDPPEFPACPVVVPTLGELGLSVFGLSILFLGARILHGIKRDAN